MNIILKCFLIFLLTGNVCFSQGIESIPKIKLEPKKLVVLYDMEYKPDSTNLDAIYTEPLLLQIANNQSKFISYWIEYRDSLYNACENLQQLDELKNNPLKKPPHTSIRYIILKDYVEKRITHHEMILPDMFRYQEPLESFDWQITDEKKKWLKYTLQKATTEFGGRKWEAWFAPEIPISDGPYKFNGLPGLIVIARDTRDHYVFKMRSIYVPEDNSYIEMYKNMRYVDTDKKGFVRAYKNFRQDIFERARNAGLNSPEIFQVIAENLRKDNNPIELIFD
ncbi:MAG: GLPGLI family protein [Bacteroidetes bacterium]|nr:GLPGLI family protein [Bacteroidota bacterium]